MRGAKSSILGLPDVPQALSSRPASPPAASVALQGALRARKPALSGVAPGQSGAEAGGWGLSEPGGQAAPPDRASPHVGAAAGSERPQAPRPESPGDALARAAATSSNLGASARLGSAQLAEPGPARHGIRSPRVPPNPHTRPCTVSQSFASVFRRSLPQTQFSRASTSGKVFLEVITSPCAPPFHLSPAEPLSSPSPSPGSSKAAELSASQPPRSRGRQPAGTRAPWPPRRSSRRAHRGLSARPPPPPGANPRSRLSRSPAPAGC